MSNPLHHESKKEFQLERLILFSDAVFAIAITLLVIEIRVPELHDDYTDTALLKKLGQLVPKFLGFIISFFIIGRYWVVHHTIFGFVTRYDAKLIRLNLFFLFTIVLMPFTNGLYGEYSAPHTMHLITPVAFYAGNVCLTGLTNYMLYSYVSNPKHKLAEFPSENYVREGKMRSLIVPSIFLLSIPVAMFNGYLARYVPILIPIVMGFVARRFRSKHANIQTA